MNNTNYWHNRGIRIDYVISICRDELGLNPKCWSHLSTAYEIAKARIIARTY